MSRTAAMVEAYRSGKTMEEVGDVFGLTRQRVHHILKAAGITGKDSPRRFFSLARSVDRARRAADRNRLRDECRYLSMFGCSREAFLAITGAPWSWNSAKLTKDHPGTAYACQRRNAGVRGIRWAMTFPEWWQIWQESGRWEQRGRGHGYCMARRGDTGPYSVGNVYICTGSQNTKDFQAAAVRVAA